MKSEILLVLALSSMAYGDYDCMCNYNVEQPVYASPAVSGTPLGYMYEFDCKPVTKVQENSDKLYTIQFEKKTGYVSVGPQVQLQTCPGEPSSTDLIPATTMGSVTTMIPTTTSVPTTIRTTTPIHITSKTKTTTTTTTPKPSPIATPRTTTTTATTTPKPTTTTPRPTTTSMATTTPKPTTTTTKPTTTTMATTTTPKPTTTTTKPTTTTMATTTTPKPTTTTTKPTTTTMATTTPKPTTTTMATTTPKPTTRPTTTTMATTQSTTTTQKATTSTIKTTQRITTMPSTTRVTTPFQKWSMAANVQGTPYQYIGVGYNLLKGNPDTTSDPGYLTSRRIFQLTGNSSSVREAVYDKHAICTSQRKTVLLYGSKAYQEELKGFVHPSSTHNAHLADSAFTQNIPFGSMRQSLDNTNKVVIDKITSCNYGSVRYLTENVNTGKFFVTREFAKDVCALPVDLTTNIANSSVKYMRFLDKWGTSIVTRVELGTKLVDRYQTTPGQVFQHVQQTDNNLLTYEGPYKGFTSSVAINTHDYPNSKAALTTFGTHLASTMGSRLHQIPISADLVPISDALNMAYWQPIADELVSEGICSDTILGSGITKYVGSINLALNQYSAYKNDQSGYKYSHTLIDRPAIQVPITWPSGTYGLMKSANGCPADNTRWSEGWRRFDTEDTFSSHNSFSPGIQNYLSGEFHSNDILNRFCIKTSTHSISGSQYDQQWPRGSYCLLKKGACPSGFGSGYIYWDDEDLTNHNAAGGLLPDGTYDKNTKMYFCCRNDGSPSVNIILPRDRPFVLLRYGRTCQSVQGMSVHEVFVRWDDENTFNKDKSSGMHPLDDGGSSNHKIHFCYYQSAAAGPGLIG